MQLRKLGFCGADDSVSPRALGVIYQAFPLVEFGVLFRPDKEGEPRYASKEWVDEVSEVAAKTSMTLAAHLCGMRVNQLLDGDDAFIATLHSKGFRRIQINATAVNGVDTSNLASSLPHLTQIITNYQDQFEFIIQKNQETEPLWNGLLQFYIKNDSGSNSGSGSNSDSDSTCTNNHGTVLPSNVTMLVDESKGTGLLASSWPQPPTEYNIGYAGGIGPNNIENVLTNIVTVTGDKLFWIDMESSLRTIDTHGNDTFDLNKCFSCIDSVYKFLKI